MNSRSLRVVRLRRGRGRAPWVRKSAGAIVSESGKRGLNDRPRSHRATRLRAEPRASGYGTFARYLPELTSGLGMPHLITFRLGHQS
jgi:hypothetical protein